MSSNSKCGKCNKFLSSGKTEAVYTCKGKCQKLYHKLCAKATKGVCDECLKDYPLTPTSNSSKNMVFLDLDPKNMTLETLLEELNKKMEVVFKIKEDTGFYAQKYDEMITKQNDLLDLMKKQQNKVDDLSNKCKYLEKFNQALEQRVQCLEQATNSKNIEIQGIKMQDKEVLNDVLAKIMSKMGTKQEDVESYWRVGKQIPGRRPPAIVIKLRNEAVRDEWMNKKGLVRTYKDMYPESDDNSPIFINEHLTKYFKDLLWNAKTKLKDMYQYVWVKKGQILCKKSDGARVFNIVSVHDIEKLLSSS